MRPGASIDSELLRQVRRLFTPTRGSTSAPPRVGLEIELIVLDVLAGFAPVPVADVRRALATDPRIAACASVTFEPGGQLELSLGPFPTPRALLTATKTVLTRVDQALARLGLRSAAHGVDPRIRTDDLALQIRTERYLALKQHFDTIGPAGRRMMCQTCSLQVCVDLAAGPDGRRQWLASNVVGPALAALFRDPAGLDNRTAIWRDVDPTRTGFDARQLHPDMPENSYTAFAMAARPIPVPPERTGADTLRAWSRGRRTPPDGHDVSHHLSTLFPPVRPRGYLEVRYLDTQPIPGLEAAVILLSCLLADRIGIAAAIDISGGLDGLPQAWSTSADQGLEDPYLASLAEALVHVAISRVGPIDTRWPGWLPATAVDTLREFFESTKRLPPAPVCRVAVTCP